MDPILAIVINLTVFVFARVKLVQVLKILLQKVPEDVNLFKIRQRILCLDKVDAVSHLHIWSLIGEKMVVTVHVRICRVQSLNDVGEVKQHIQNIFRFKNGTYQH